MSIGERIKAARESAGMTQEELGRLCGTTKQSIYKYENGVVTNIPLERVEKIANVTGIPAAYLMGWDEDTPTPPALGKEQLQAAFWGGDKDLTQDEKDAMWDDVERFAAFLAQQKKQEKQKDD